MAKVAIVGATGKVGQYAALSISRIPYVREVQLYGRPGSESVLEGVARDLIDSFAATGTDSHVSWSCAIEDLKGSDIIVFAAGIARKPEQTRLDLAVENARIVRDFAQKIGTVAPGSFLMMVTNPVDIMTHVALKYSGKKPNEVFGLGTHLDSMRLKSAIASFFQVHVSEVHTRIIGEHGDSMVPLWSATTIGGIQISNLPSFAQVPIEDIMHQVRSSGQKIIASKGATVWGPGEAIATLIRTILGNENRILTVSAYIKAEVHNIGDVCIGVPARINRSGVYPVPIRIEPLEVRNFQNSVEKIRGITREIFTILEKGE
ncbi:MAG TPA: malate dehydrogenase [Methanospirillum sp.]|uniref:malate dehydrogenase n=1 Tax=Methanospirillum sp. TaxID=45200 RepID=UPI002B7E36BE|nr:malate dehydrogenase [Methanospirillum sp.]HOJ95685.1 malate dehydrogenase [Methanospirillum sp.]HOL40284.1 malate dehydrogenase [Methanospirillum sp.]HPP77723.1 malate dehydrogenase [Methanospirillum sp.]